MNISNILPSFWAENEKECLTRLLEEDCWGKLPLLNANNKQVVPHNKLVKFRGMIQDMFDPEYYFDKYEVVDKKSQEKSFRSSRYCDSAHFESFEEIDYNSPNNVTKERHTLVVVSIPALNSWVDVDNQQDVCEGKSSTSNINIVKRSAEEEMETEFSSELQENKKLCIQTQSSQIKSVVSHEDLLNFPLPGQRGRVCHLKIYSSDHSLKINQLVEFVGFLSLDPVLTDLNYHNNECDTEMEIHTHNPPPSLVPRIHCVSWKLLENDKKFVLNPLCDLVVYEKMTFLKRELHILLTQLLLGDHLAAEYFIYHLISKVYSRGEMMALGKFTLNVFNLPVQLLPNYGKQLYEIIELLVPKSYYLPMSLKNMNELTFIPKKDYTCNRLTSGLLQLSDGTHLILDETKLETGQLQEPGVRAVAAISSAIKTQKVSYDFNYYHMDFNCDIPFLILSDGKSFLPKDYCIPLKCEQECVSTFDEIVLAAKQFLKPELLNDLRAYLVLARNGEYNLDEKLLEVIQNDFVKMRQEKKATADDLHELLVLARLICLSEGKNSLDESSWRRACNLEAERKQRIS